MAAVRLATFNVEELVLCLQEVHGQGEPKQLLALDHSNNQGA